MPAGGDQVSAAGDGVFRHGDHVSAGRDEVSGRLDQLSRVRDAVSAGGDQMSRNSDKVHEHCYSMPTHRYAVSPLFRGADGVCLAGDRLARLRAQARHGKPAAGIIVPHGGNPLSHDRGLPGDGKDIEVGAGAQAIPEPSAAAALLPVKGG